MASRCDNTSTPATPRQADSSSESDDYDTVLIKYENFDFHDVIGLGKIHDY